MNIGRRWLAWAWVAVMLAFPATALAQSDTLEKIKSKGVLVVGVKNDYKPWGFVDPSGQIVGMEIDMAKDVAQKLGVKTEFVPVTAANRMEFLQQGRIDLLIATMGDNAARRKVVGIIDPNYYAGAANVLAKKSYGFKQWSDLKGRKVCAQQGAYYNKRATDLYGMELVNFPAIPEAFNALQQGACVAFLFDDTLFQSMLSGGDPKWADYEMPLVSEDPAPWGIAVRLDDLNAPFGKLMHDQSIEWHKSGRLLELERKWGIKESPFLREMNTKYKSS
jgi:polar amino acid transport system substrate-binding protein